MRIRIAGENQDGSKWSIERHRTRRGRFESRQPPPQQSLHTQDNARKHQKAQTIHRTSLLRRKTPTSLKHAESVRIAIVTRHPTDSTPTRKTINDNNNGK